MPLRQLPRLLVPIGAAAIAAAGAVATSGGAGEADARASLRAHAQAAAGPKMSLFARTSVWNRPLPADAALDRSNFTLMTAFRAEVDRERRRRIGPWIQTRDSTTPIYIVGRRRPKRRVHLDVPHRPWYRSLHRALRRVPLPRRMKPTAGPDGFVTIWQPSRDRLWEFWKARRRVDGWHVKWAGAMRRVSENPGYYTSAAWPGARPNWGASATSLPLIAGTMRIGELRRGHIPHALAMAVPNARAGVFSWPAQRTDGTGGPTLLPEGARLRLDPDLDIDALDLPPVTRMMAEAAQRYGIVVRDRTKEAVTFFAEDLTASHGDPYRGPGGLFGGASPRELMAAFPWKHLQLLKMSLCSRAPCPRRDAP